MVPCQPRQLVILSLPFAALVAFFWFKRRRSLSRSDPGGTAARQKPGDITQVNGKLSGEKITQKIESQSTSQAGAKEAVEKILVKSLVKSEEASEKVACEPLVVKEDFVSKSINQVESPSENTGKEIIKLVKPTKRTPEFEEKEIVCNGSAGHIKEDPESHPSTPDFEDHTIFHSTVIESDKEVEESKPDTSVENQAVEENHYCNIKEEEHICEELKSVENSGLRGGADSNYNKEKVEEEFQQNKTIPLEEQSTVEFVHLNKSTVEDTLTASVSSEETKEKSDSKTCASSDTLETVENVSVDTGLGSQDPSAVEECNVSMAQGQKTDEKNESNNATGLEQKLASLGLDTSQQPGQRAERDSANHSPAEVMLNSPAISTFSDAHSEVMNWLNRCEPAINSKHPKVEMFDLGPHLFVSTLQPQYPCAPVLWCPIFMTWGSSDSGKGCSDVVTPPSRTPAGGSSVAGDLAPSVYEFVLPQVIVGRLIGRHGAFLHDIRAKTHTNVFIKKHPETNSLKICAIEGTQQDIDAALKMIRQKFPLRRFPDLTLEKVSFVKNPCLPINPENLQLHLVEGVNNDVILSSLITAGHFFLQMPMHMSYQSLYKLACIMNSVYNTQESPPLVEPQPDVVCVAPAHGGWYRAQIMTVEEETNASEVKFLDYGGYMTVDNACLRQIRGDFLLLPFQAVECVLANVTPAGGEETWSEEARQFVQLMTTNQTLQAQVYDYTETGLPLVYLYCTQFYQSLTDPSGYETKVVLLNQELVSHGFADLIDSSQDDQTAATESS